MLASEAGDTLLRVKNEAAEVVVRDLALWHAAGGCRRRAEIRARAERSLELRRRAAALVLMARGAAVGLHALEGDNLVDGSNLPVTAVPDTGACFRVWLAAVQALAAGREAVPMAIVTKCAG